VIIGHFPFYSILLKGIHTLAIYCFKLFGKNLFALNGGTGKGLL